MSNKIFYKILTVILLLCCIIPHPTYALKWEDDDTPISFKLELLPWDYVDKIIPNKTKFTIVDVETGLYFNVQRRAGNQHADVQPLTRKDTKIMKKIYSGEWSWKRRAIIVVVNDQMIAASMHGMPHGAGALQNGFPGHFCVHFYGSITHRLKNEDPSHKLMILKAAGKIDEYLNTVNPYELINIFTIAINQGDRQLLKMILSNSGYSKRFDEILKDITYLRVNILSTPSSEGINEMILVEIPVQINIYTKKQDRKKKRINFIIRRDSLTHRWLIDQELLYKYLK
ncbi:hypothetical protein QUF99_12600 [Bacillus sp. DX4.1]|uniref:hypothetical protein n=1 Tax=Bacillus sp. DX4.1 TaxID=3055867 RepID=UPI0025A19AD3|nr:hypothetical protein [Bacillus sp. DX4.1]MDM5188129.1 hypothetical protein [Bacillus sp. DX4.1]